MIAISVRELLTATAGELLHGDERMAFTGVTTDSRTVQPGDLYIPIIGERYDGNDFIADAMERGAAWCLLSDLSKIPLDENLDDRGLIFVHDTLIALQDLAGYVLKKQNIPVVAVTGSTGKTSTKELVAAVLETQYKVLRNEGNLNNHIGVPLTCLRISPEHQVAVLEMGMNHAGELRRLAEITRPGYGVITNIGISHIENLGSKEGILQAKLEIAEYMGPDNVLFVNGDDPYLDRLPEGRAMQVVTVGSGEACACRVSERQLYGLEGSSFIVQWAAHSSDRISCRLPLPGDHNIQNAALAAAVGLQLGVTPENIAKGLQSARNTGMRLNVTETPGGITLINDAYNASPDSMHAALQVLREVPAARRFAALSDMLELGHEAENGHRQVGAYAKTCGVDHLFVAGPQSRWIAQGALEAGMQPEQVAWFESREALTEELSRVLQPGDAVLVKGSRGMRMERVAEALLEDC